MKPQPTELLPLSTIMVRGSTAPHYQSVQALRALAAISVLLVHVNIFGYSFGIGQSGVDVFFVISGFIIGTIGVGENPARFFSKRVIRIVPLYWTATTVMCLLSLVPRLSTNFTFSAGSLMKSFLFIPYFSNNGNIEPLLVPGWTLNYEMFFYGVFAMALRTRRAIPIVVTTIIACVMAGLVLAPTSAVLQTYMSPIMLEFAAGLALSQAAFVRGTWTGAALLVTAVVWFCVVALAGIHMEHARVLWVGIPAVALVSGALALERAGRWPHLRPLVLVGDASYSLYLLHLFVISFVQRLMQTEHLPVFLNVPLVLSFGIGTALISYHFFEVPSARLCRSLLGPNIQARRNDRRLLGPM